MPQWLMSKQIPGPTNGYPSSVKGELPRETESFGGGELPGGPEQRVYRVSFLGNPPEWGAYKRCSYRGEPYKQRSAVGRHSRRLGVSLTLAGSPGWQVTPTVLGEESQWIDLPQFLTPEKDLNLAEARQLTSGAKTRTKRPTREKPG